MGEDFLTYPIPELVGKNLYAFPPQAVVHRFFDRLLEIPTPWALVVSCFESPPPTIVLAKEKGLRIFDIPANSILTPTKIQTEMGFWKVASNISTIKIVTNRLWS